MLEASPNEKQLLKINLWKWIILLIIMTIMKPKLFIKISPKLNILHHLKISRQMTLIHFLVNFATKCLNHYISLSMRVFAK